MKAIEVRPTHAVFLCEKAFNNPFPSQPRHEGTSATANEESEEEKFQRGFG